MVSASGFSHQTCRPSFSASAVSSAWVSCGVAITTMPTSGSSMTGKDPVTAFSKRCRSAARRAVIPLAEVTATKRLKPARRNAGISVPVENAPAPIQPIPSAGPAPGRGTSPRMRRETGRAGRSTTGAPRRGRGRVAQLDRQVRVGALLDQLVRRGGVADVVAVGDQVGHLEPARGQQVEHGLEVPALGPADLPDRVVDPPRLVRRVVAARAVGAGEPQRDLPLVERRPRPAAGRRRRRSPRRPGPGTARGPGSPARRTNWPRTPAPRPRPARATRRGPARSSRRPARPGPGRRSRPR